MKAKIGIIGCGNMGEVILANTSKEYSCFVCEKEKERCHYLHRRYPGVCSELETVAGHCSIIILAVKPQDIEDVLGQLKNHLKKNTLIISIAAGITTNFIERKLGRKMRVVRTMPNMPAMVSQGITAICRGRFSKKSDISLAEKIFSHLGRTIVVPEKDLDAITAVSGSGPAYVFLFMECLIKAARSLGLSETVAVDLVQQTFIGSVDLLQKKRLDPVVLRAKVTSKGGTTQAAMDVFAKGKIDQIFKQALTAAKKRAKFLSRR